MYKTSTKHLKKSTYLLYPIYFGVFLFCVQSEPIYSPDTYSYLNAMPYRQMGYVVFFKLFTTIFGSHWDSAVVVIHTIFSLSAVHYFFLKVSKLFKLSLLLQLSILIILLFPFFPPLSIVNNLVSEGLGYGLYLLFISIGMEILFNNKRQYFKYYILVYLLLFSVRSQFMFSTLIFAGTYFIMYRKQILRNKHLISLILLFGIILIAGLSERTYHKLKDGFFKPTPLGYTSASTAPICLSKKSDYKLIKDKNYREIFIRSFDTLTHKDLLVRPEFSTKEAYMFFHNNLPKICNQTIRQQGVDYYFENHRPKGWDIDKIVAYSFFETEAACKDFTKVLILNNFQQWLKLYYVNITYGFKSQLLLWLIVIIFFTSLIKSWITGNRDYLIIFLLSSLILSNAMFIAFASHSIQRYLFYNYALIFLLFISIYNLKRSGKKS
jgi:O-antigen ligase